MEKPPVAMVPKVVADGVEKVHAPEHQQHGFHHREKDIDLPEQHGRVLDPGLELVRYGPGDFRLVELHAPDAEKRENGQGEHDDAHAPEPVRQAAPEQQTVGHAFDIREHRGPGGGKAGHGFEDRVHHGIENPAEIEGQGAEDTGREPAEGDHGHALPVTHGPGFLGTEGQEQDTADCQAEYHGSQQGQRTAVSTGEGIPQGE